MSLTLDERALTGNIADDLEIAQYLFKPSSREAFLEFCFTYIGVYRVGTLYYEGETQYYNDKDVFLIPAIDSLEFTDLRCDPQRTLLAYRANKFVTEAIA